jgi:hypothetical protein
LFWLYIEAFGYDVLTDPATSKLNDKGEAQFPENLLIKWAYVSANYEILSYVPGKKRQDELLKLLITWYEDFDGNQKKWFRKFLPAVRTDPAARFPKLLAEDLMKKIR